MPPFGCDRCSYPTRMQENYDQIRLTVRQSGTPIGCPLLPFVISLFYSPFLSTVFHHFLCLHLAAMTGIQVATFMILKHKDAGGEATSKSQRSSEDAVAPMRIATTNAELRLMAAGEGMDKVSSEFQPCDDVSFGGVLLDCNEFTTHAVKLTSGGIAEMQLAERGTLSGELVIVYCNSRSSQLSTPKSPFWRTVTD